MPDKSPEITGKNWRREVGSSKADKETILKRNEFYEKAAGLRLEIDADLIKIVKHPESKGLKTQEDLNKEKEFKYKVKEGKNERLYNILDMYFRKMEVKPADREKEVALSLFCLTQQGVNVDLVVPSWKVEITAGQLFITKSTGEFAVNGAYLRSIPGVAGKPGEGWTALPPIPGLPAKPQEEKKKAKRHKPKAKTPPKPSDILETF